MYQVVEMTDKEKFKMYTERVTHEELARMHIELEKYIPKMTLAGEVITDFAEEIEKRG